MTLLHTYVCIHISPSRLIIYKLLVGFIIISDTVLGNSVGLKQSESVEISRLFLPRQSCAFHEKQSHNTACKIARDIAAVVIM